MTLPIDSIVQAIVAFHALFPAIGTLYLLMMLDVLLGIGAAFITKELSSSISRQGMVRKLMTLLLLAVCKVVEPYANGVPIAGPGAMLFIYTEIISILENCKRAGLPIPQQMLDALPILHKRRPPVEQPAPTTVQNVTVDHASNVSISTTDGLAESAGSVHSDSGIHVKRATEPPAPT